MVDKTTLAFVGRFLELLAMGGRLFYRHHLIKGAWKYLYRAVDSTGQTIDFMLSSKRDARAAKRFFRKMLKAASQSFPRVINVDKNPAYPRAVEQLKEEGTFPTRSLWKIALSEVRT